MPSATRKTPNKTASASEAGAAKPAVKAPAKPAKPAVKTSAAQAATPHQAAATAAKTAKADKPKKPKLVRDSFTIPKTEYGVLDQLKQRAAKAGNEAKKSELLRAGIKALAAMDDSAFVAALKAVPAIKTGRPAKA